ncbi:hypothetical protein B0T24DRAFT_712060 [Lasiosphaeria ovina]|uniref:Uncharacterized protein n=1 Tax=Lasiosphaeria ovina TaxID=92902 RepID=A0AAE0JUW1_9PEZI|nr:hypothetical protein B0T24DRAFT_712060 [Lasiosphaeria ovina]
MCTGLRQSLAAYMNSGPIVAIVWEGLDAVKTGRYEFSTISNTKLKKLNIVVKAILGATNPLASAPGTIRG